MGSNASLAEENYPSLCAEDKRISDGSFSCREHLEEYALAMRPFVVKECLHIVKFHQHVTTRWACAPVGRGYAVLAASAAIFDALRSDVLEALPSEQAGVLSECARTCAHGGMALSSQGRFVCADTGYKHRPGEVGEQWHAQGGRHERVLPDDGARPHRHHPRLPIALEHILGERGISGPRLWWRGCALASEGFRPSFLPRPR